MGRQRASAPADAGGASEPTYGVVLVPSVSHALRAEKVLVAAGVPVKLIPTPRQLSSDCGTALRFSWPLRDAVQRVIEETGLTYDRIAALPER